MNPVHDQAYPAPNRKRHQPHGGDGKGRGRGGRGGRGDGDRNHGRGHNQSVPVTPTRPLAAGLDHHADASMGLPTSPSPMGGMMSSWTPPPPPQLSIPRSLGPSPSVSSPVRSSPAGAPNTGCIPAGLLYPQYHRHPHSPVAPQPMAHASPPAMPNSTGCRIASHMHDLAHVSPFTSPSLAPHPPPLLGNASSMHCSPSSAPLPPNHPYAYPGPHGWPAANVSAAPNTPAAMLPMVQYASPPPPAAFLAHQHNLHRSPASPSRRGSPRSAAAAYSPRGGPRETPLTPPPASGHAHVGRMSGSGRGNRSGSGRRFQHQQQQLHQQLGPPIPFRLPYPAEVAKPLPGSPTTVQAPCPSPAGSLPTPAHHPQASSQHPHPLLPPKPPALPSPHAHPSPSAHSPTSLPSSPTSSPTSPTPNTAKSSDLPRLGSTPVPVARRLAQRQKQIDYGKNTLGYQNYLAAVPKAKRKRSDPVTPDKTAECSARSWAAQIKKWRRELHRWDHSANAGHGAEATLPPLDSPSFSPSARSIPKTQPRNSHHPDRLSGDRNDESDASEDSVSPLSSRANSPSLAFNRHIPCHRRQEGHGHSTQTIPPPPLSSSPPPTDRHPSPPSPMHSWPRPNTPQMRASASSSTSSPPPRSETAWSVADSITESWGIEQEEAVRRVLTMSQAVAAQAGQGDDDGLPRPVAARPTTRGVVFQDDPLPPSAAAAANSGDPAPPPSVASSSADDLPPYLTPQGYMHYYPPFMLSSSIAGGLPLFRRPRRASDASTTSHGTARSAVSGGRAAAAAAAAAGRGGGGGAGTEYSVSDSEMSVRDDIYAAEYEWSWER